MMNSSTQYNSAPQPCCFIFDVMGWQIFIIMAKKVFNIKVWMKTTRKTKTVSFEKEPEANKYVSETLKNMESGFVSKFEVYATERP